MPGLRRGEVSALRRDGWPEGGSTLIAVKSTTRSSLKGRWTGVIRLLVPSIAAFAGGTAWGQDFLCEPIPVGSDRMQGVPEYQVDEGAATTPVTIDVMLLYSPRAIERRIHGLLNRTIDDVNEIYQESGTGITIRLVGTYVMNDDSDAAEAAQRVEASTRDTWSEHSSDLLEAVQNDSGVDSVRRDVGADVVVAWTTSFAGWSGAGLAYSPTSRSHFYRSSGFAAIHSDGLDKEWTPVLVAHEIGHNLGLHHHPEAPGRTPPEQFPPYLSYGQGYLGQSTPLGYRYMTVMGTTAGSTDFRYPILRFSRDGFYNFRGYNIPIGTSNHRAADAARVTAPWVAAYEAEPDSDSDSDSDSPPAAPSNLTGEAPDATTVRLTWLDRSDNEDGFEVHYRPEGGAWGQLQENQPANTSSMRLVWETFPGVKRWSFRVRAFNDYGVANSNTVTVTLPDPAPPLVLVAPYYKGRGGVVGAPTGDVTVTTDCGAKTWDEDDWTGAISLRLENLDCNTGGLEVDGLGLGAWYWTRTDPPTAAPLFPATKLTGPAASDPGGMDEVDAQDNGTYFRISGYSTIIPHIE